VEDGVFDLVIVGGSVIDGSGTAPYRADIGVTAGRIAAVDDLTDAAAETVVSATGRYVLPGFIDAHSHADATLTRPEVQLAALRQGVTTLICGQDGLSVAPTTAAALAFVNRYFAAINGPVEPPLTVAELLASWDRRSAVNGAFLVPHGTLRYRVLGGAGRPPEPAELATMRNLVEQGLTDGAVGLSTGLEYLPGRYAAVAEIAELCRPVAAAGLPYVTHMRGYGQAAPAGMAEARAIAAAAGVGLHVSHYHGPGELLASLVDDSTTFDSYPYLRSCTILAMAALPRWLDDTDLDRAARGLTERRADVLSALDPGLWPRITLAHAPGVHAWTEGLRLPDAAASSGRSPGELLLDILLDTGLTASAVIDAPPTTTEESVRLLARHPGHMGGSDGIVVGGHPHPRAWGAFAHFLGRHVRELGDWSWPDAAEHLAVRPARRFGLTDRGRIRVGLAADLAVIDPQTVTDVATYEQPREPAAGVADVVVNGAVVLRDGQLTGALTGRALRPYPGG
jgi:N-acyl-D-amino-acid deacylase